MFCTDQRCLRRTVCLVLVIAFLLPLAGCAAKQQEIDWKLYGTYVTQGGEVQEKIEFSISGKIPVEPPKTQVDAPKIELDIVWPDRFRFSNSGTRFFPTSTVIVPKTDTESFFFISTFLSDDLSIGDVLPGTIGLSPEKEFVIFYWGNDYDPYIVASTDPNTDPAAIEEYFSNMLSDYSFFNK